MSIFDRTSDEVETPVPEEPKPQRRFTDKVQEIGTVIGSGAKFKGEIRGKTNLEIRGTHEGSCEIEGLLTVWEEGALIGDVHATNVVLAGKVDGNVHATNKLEMRSTSRIEGEIKAGAVAMAEGCFIKGSIDMTKTSSGGQSSTFKEKRGKK